MVRILAPVDETSDLTSRAYVDAHGGDSDTIDGGDAVSAGAGTIDGGSA